MPHIPHVECLRGQRESCLVWHLAIFAGTIEWLEGSNLTCEDRHPEAKASGLTAIDRGQTS